MATTQSPKDANAKQKKAPVAPITRISDQMKKATLAGKITKEELDTIANLATSLKVFLG